MQHRQYYVNGEVVHRTQSTKYLGAYLDSRLDFKQHIKSKCKAAMLNLHRIKSVWKNLTRLACNKLVVALVLSHLDYANSLLWRATEIQHQQDASSTEYGS